MSLILLLENTKLVGRSSSILVTAAGVRLPDEPAKLVKISNWNVENDTALTLKASGGALIEEEPEEVYWGFGGVYAHQLFMSKETDWIPVQNLQQICLRSRSATDIQVWYSWLD